MPGDTPAADFHSLTPEAIIAVVEKAIGKGCTNLFRPLNSYVNRVYELELEEGGTIIVKFYRPGRWSGETIQDEHDFLLELAGREIPVIPPLVLTDGRTLGRIGIIFYAIFPKKSGRICDEFTLDQWEEIGRLLGRVHAVGGSRSPRDRPVMTPGEMTRRQVEFLVEGGFVVPELVGRYRQVTATLLDRIEPLFEGVETIRIHGDCHFANIIQRPGESFFLIDFDDMVTGPPIQDLWMLLPGYAAESGVEIETFLEGYETFRRFDRRTLALIEPLRAMRYIHYTAWCAFQAGDGGFSRLDANWGGHDYWQGEIRDLEDQIRQIDLAQ